MLVDCIGEWVEEFEMGELSWWKIAGGCGKGGLKFGKGAEDYERGGVECEKGG